MAQIYKPSTQEVEAENSEFDASMDYKVRPYLKKTKQESKLLFKLASYIVSENLSEASNILFI